MPSRSFLSGLLLGALLGAGAMFLFGDKIVGGMGDTTKEVGRSVEKAGETLKEQGDKLK